MFKIFIFSNAFATHNMINSINYLLNMSIDEVLVLGENHRQNDFIEAGIKVTVNESIEFCIDNSDLIIMLLDENIPTRSSERVMDLAKIKGKMILKLRNPWTKQNCTPDKQLYSDMKNMPSVLILSVGKNAQEIYTELTINEMFFNKKVNIIQDFSSSSVDLFNQLNNYGVLNQHLREQIYEEKTKGVLFVSTVCISGTDIKELRNCCFNILNRLYPDVLIIQAGYSYEIEKIRQIVEKSTSHIIDMVIRSNFVSHNDSMVYCADANTTQELLIGKRVTPQIILNAILSKTAFPNGCKVISCTSGNST